MTKTRNGIDRRSLLKGGAFTLAAAGSGFSLFLPEKASAENAKVVVQYDWLMSNGQIGDIVALKKGLFEAAGLDVEFSPGGPNSSTVPPVVTGQAALGQFSDSAQLLLARASGVPVKIIACGFRQGPFAFYSLPKAPIRTVQDMVGKRIGIQPTARFVLDAILAKNGIDPSSLTITNIGFDMTPLVAGQVDAVTGWITNTQALAVIGPDRIDLMMSDTGLPSYSNVYFATDDAIANHSDTLAKFIGAVAKGWGWTHANPKEAVELTVAAYPQLDLAIELATVPRILSLSFDAATAKDGWGTFDPASIAEQIAIYDKIGQFKGTAPKLDDVMTTKILELTAAERPKIG
ncbi:ABC transporter substrate-binding protein [Kaistia dalseonensis]|uniref:Thiamine pyrimidine synthase n=1 Tax=Kaistia dalseonensis TaxID=410840 RepID=A0ABU0HDI1_9HYPH|nr:ABC transporter substrate-binding protein [Kaistia dalseonensis]MCX5497153.1 ABC transporter substrate-binding protein [Kaistia dalseonensis]MDQ0439780.1 NitT/TauT family transport system substrate-binding protein [Kaistia dalseonensis]